MERSTQLGIYGAPVNSSVSSVCVVRTAEERERGNFKEQQVGNLLHCDAQEKCASRFPRDRCGEIFCNEGPNLTNILWRPNLHSKPNTGLRTCGLSNLSVRELSCISLRER
jgi:hypothetical protein